MQKRRRGLDSTPIATAVRAILFVAGRLREKAGVRANTSRENCTLLEAVIVATECRKVERISAYSAKCDSKNRKPKIPFGQQMSGHGFTQLVRAHPR